MATAGGNGMIRHLLGDLAFHVAEYIAFFPRFSWEELSDQPKVPKDETIDT